MCELSAKLYGFVVIFNLDKNSHWLWTWKPCRIWIIRGKIRLSTCMSKGQQHCFDRRCECWPTGFRNYTPPRGTAGTHATNVNKGQTVKVLMNFKMSFKLRKIIGLIKGKFMCWCMWIYLRCWETLEKIPSAKPVYCSLFTACLLLPSVVITCCKAWRKLPSLHPSHWCEWHRSQPAGCWSRNGSRQGWSSSGETLKTRSTASPEHAAIRLGRSYKPSPPVETPPEEVKRGLYLRSLRVHLEISTVTHFTSIILLL